MKFCTLCETSSKGHIELTRKVHCQYSRRVDPSIDKGLYKGSGDHTENERSFLQLQPNYQFVKILKGVLIESPNVQNFENESENLALRAQMEGARRRLL